MKSLFIKKLILIFAWLVVMGSVSLADPFGDFSDDELIAHLNQQLDFWSSQKTWKDPASERSKFDLDDECNEFTKRRLELKHLTQTELGIRSNFTELENRDLLIFFVCVENKLDTLPAGFYEERTQQFWAEWVRRGYHPPHPRTEPILAKNVEKLSLGEIKERYCFLLSREVKPIWNQFKQGKLNIKPTPCKEVEEECAYLSKSYVERGGDFSDLESLDLQESCTIL